MAGGKGPLKVESAGGAVEVEDLAGEGKAGDEAAAKGLRVHLFQGHAAARHHRAVPAFGGRDRERKRGKKVGEGAASRPGNLSRSRGGVEAGESAEKVGEGARKVGGEECAECLSPLGEGPGVEACEPFGSRGTRGEVEAQGHLGAVAEEDGDVARQVQDRRAGEAGVGEEKIAGDSRGRAAGKVNADAGGGESDSGEFARPGFARDKGDKGGGGFDDCMAGLACEGVAGAGRAQVGVAFAAGREDDGVCGDATAGGLDAAEGVVFDPEGAGGGGEAEADAQVAGAADEGPLDVGGGVGDGKDVEPVGGGGGDAEGMEESAEVVGTEGVECGQDETSVASEAGGELTGGKRIGEVAPAAAGREEFYAGARELFEEDDAATEFGGGDGGQEAGGSGADDGEVEHGFGHGKTLYSAECGVRNAECETTSRHG